MIEQLVISFFVVAFFAASFAWSVERCRLADYETDLAEQIARGEIDSRNLRRATRHKKVRKAFDRRYARDGTLEFIDENRTEGTDEN